jgi:hypothetical protein
MKCDVLYQRLLTIDYFECCGWETVSNVGLDASFDNMQKWKGIREQAREVNSTKACVTNGDTSGWIRNGSYYSDNVVISFYDSRSSSHTQH